MTESKEKERLAWPDLARGFAVFLVALGHSPLTGDALKYWIYTFHMPLFFFISGYFAVRKEDSVLKMIQKKARALLPIYFIGSFGGFLLESVLAGRIRWDSLLGIFLCQFGKYDGYLWFFPAVFGFQCLLILAWKRLRNSLHVLGLCCIAAVCTLFFRNLVEIRFPWHMDTAFLLAPYAGLGLIFCKKGAFWPQWFDTSKKEWLAIAALLVIQMISCYLNAKTGSGHIDYNSLVTNEWFSCYLSGTSGVMAIVLICKKPLHFKGLSFVGKNSAIYYCMSWIGSRLVLPGMLPILNLGIAMLALWCIPIPVVWSVNRWFPWLLGSPRERRALQPGEKEKTAYDAF